MAEIEKEWRERAEYWEQSDIDDELKSGLAATVNQHGHKFWEEANERLIPTLRRNDEQAALRALDRIDVILEEHQEAIHELVAKSDELSAALSSSSRSTVSWVSILLVLIGLTILGVCAGSLIRPNTLRR